MKSMIFSCKFLRVCALPVPAEGDSSAGRALSPASVRSEPAWSTDPCLDDRPSQWTIPWQIPKCEIWKNTGDLLVIVHKVPTNRPAPEFANWGLIRKMCKSPKTQTRVVVVVADPGGSHLPRFLRSHQHRPQTINNRQSRSTVAISSGQKSQSAIRRSCKKTINSRSGSHRVSGTSLAPGQNVCC